jgi:hypothetical protein
MIWFYPGLMAVVQSSLVAMMLVTGWLGRAHFNVNINANVWAPNTIPKRMVS